MALTNASISPSAICICDLWGKDPRFLSASPKTSTIDVSEIPSREARTPPIFTGVGLSIFVNVPIIRVHMPGYIDSHLVCFAFTPTGTNLLLVEHKIVELPTLV